MIAIDNHSFFNIDHLTPKFDGHTTALNAIKEYISIIKEVRRLDKVLHTMIDNIEVTLEINNIDSVKKIDDILLKLEKFSDVVDNELENKKLQRWYYLPLRYMIEKVMTSNMSLQAMLGTQQALIMDKNDTTQNTEV